MIDAHHHLWQFDLPFDYGWLKTPTHAAINRDYTLDDLQRVTSDAGVDRTVIVQTQHDLRETQWMLDLASHSQIIAGVVGWVDLTSPAAEDQLQTWLEHPRFCGVRHIVQDEPDDDFILRTDVMQGLAVLQKHRVPYDLLFYAKHLRHAETIAGRFSDLPLVIDHLAKPKIAAGEIDVWAKQMRQLGRFENLYCKISGMVTEADWSSWTVEDLRPYVDVVLEVFTPQRLMFGSDWPVCELAATYREVVAATRDLLSELSSDEQHQIFDVTATRFYGLD